MIFFSTQLTIEFVMPNGLEIGKVAKNRRMNERAIKISQLLPTTQYWVYYDYGNKCENFGVMADVV